MLLPFSFIKIVVRPVLFEDYIFTLNMKLKIIAALLFGTLDFCRADVLVNFNAPGDLGANFSGPAGGFLINETANEGLQNTRGANLANAGFSQI